MQSDYTVDFYWKNTNVSIIIITENINYNKKKAVINCIIFGFKLVLIN